LPTAEERLVSLGIALPEPVPGRPSVVPVAREGTLAFVSSRGPALDEDGRRYTGKVGRDVSSEEGYRAARLTGLNLLAILREEIGSLDRVTRCLKVTGLVNAAPGFTAMAPVLDGCSDLLVEVFGPEIGRHARTALGAAELPNDYPVAFDLVVALDDARDGG
jgi:enamine deaminase RidA (YjgF/YER057c/UK114 family)